MTPATAEVWITAAEGGFGVEIIGPLDGVIHVAKLRRDNKMRALVDDLLDFICATEIDRDDQVIAYRICAPAPAFTRYRP